MIRLTEIYYDRESCCIGQLKDKNLHNGMQTTTYSYNPRGWIKSQSSSQFSMELKYEDGSTPQYNGNIANQAYTNNSSNTFNYSYDKLNRLTSGAATGFSESLTYDNMGNINTLNRDGAGASTYSYSGNQLTIISGPSVSTQTSYLYDGNGNATTDGRNNKSISYNHLNLPQTISGGLSYTYDATGNKLKKQNTTTSTTTDYINGIHYTNNSIEFIQTEEGIARRSGSSYSYEYNLKDHLGNTRVTFHRDPNTGNIAVLQRDDYYPFGKQKSVSAYVNKYLYNGKELQEDLGLNQYDYGARFYDPVVGRWNVVDPMSEKYAPYSPYAYVGDNPIRRIDINGEDWWDQIVFAVKHPLAALRIGSATKGATNISNNAVRFSTRGASNSSRNSVLNEPDEMGNQGSQVNAFRHVLWQASITNEFGSGIASEAGFAHEENSNDRTTGYTNSSFKSIDAIDQRIDLTNNEIGRSIGESNKGLGMKDMAMKVLDAFKNDGFWTATKQEDGSYKMTKSKITAGQYDALKNVFSRLNNNGFTADEIEAQRKKEREETGSHIK